MAPERISTSPPAGERGARVVPGETDDEVGHEIAVEVADPGEGAAELLARGLAEERELLDELLGAAGGSRRDEGCEAGEGSGVRIHSLSSMW